ncbi:MAG: protein jag, partial [Clostridia bacterium]|nr:protein jag [Clostridia bacterium]
TVDVQGYREKRAETLRGVARRMSEKVLKYKKSFALEPMNAYERRIIHAECQNIQGVTTRSIGEGADRKIIISPEKK